MKYSPIFLLQLYLLLLTLIGCNSYNQTAGAQQSIKEEEIKLDPINENELNKVEEEKSESNHPIESKSINGIYSYRDNSVEIQVIVTEDNWTGKTKIISGLGDEYDESNAEYESGLIKGNDLYESSGFVKIGYIEGKSLTTSIGGNNITLYRK